LDLPGELLQLLLWPLLPSRAFQNQYELAIREAKQAIDLNPNDAYTYDQFG
jgi:hypothetical protein